MIRSIEFTGGYPMDVETLSGRKFEFTEGVNVLFGKNGCGKSTIIKACAAYGFTRSGWTTWDWTSLASAFDSDGGELDVVDLVLDCSKAKFEADVVLDGPVYLHNDEYYDGSGLNIARSGLGSGSLSMGEYLCLRMDSATSSTGEDARARFNRFMSVMNSVPPELGERPSERRAFAVKAYDYIRDNLMNGCPSVLLDEPDSGLDVPTTRRLFDTVLPAIAGEYQVVVATHSPLALFIPGLNVIDVCPGYVEECRETYRELVGAK